MLMFHRIFRVLPVWHRYNSHCPHPYPIALGIDADLPTNTRPSFLCCFKLTGIEFFGLFLTVWTTRCRPDEPFGAMDMTVPQTGARLLVSQPFGALPTGKFTVSLV